jgi:formylglycine-generating enzyme required for sulfatase activity
MRFVPAGEFTMGNDNGKDEKLAHQVYLDDYYLDKYEVTNARYKVCVDEGVCTPSGWSRFSDPSFANYPVVYVDWLMSAEYCSWRGARLPTEAEWEKAASWNDETKTKSIYPWGDTIDCSYGNFNLTTNLYGWDAESCTEDTTPVGNYPSGRSSYGLFDMAGNVEEWTSSLFLPYPYDANDGREDTVAFGRRVLRGGSYYSYYDTIRSDYRSTFRDDNSGFQDIGFRCALTPFSTLQTYNVIPSARSGSVLTIGYR